jgi:di/tricarboxylate transporter
MTSLMISVVLGKWEYQRIVQWDQLSKKFPWGVFMLKGAGLAIADAFKVNTELVYRFTSMRVW